MAEEQEVPRPEHPRPIFWREPWINLNGAWRFTFDPRDQGEQLRWYRIRPPELRRDTEMDPGGAARPFGAPRPSTLVDDPFGATIVVPFPWESRASGIQQDEQKGAAWYQRVITVPEDWASPHPNPLPKGEGTRGAEGLASAEDTAGSSTAIGSGVRWRLQPYLCFGAVDWNAKVWVNGRFAGGAGWIEYTVPIPEGVELTALSGLRLRCEIAARTARSRVGWHDPRYEQSTDYPQTEAYKLPSQVVVAVNGVPLGTVALLDDPADAAGVLSAHNSPEWEFASYGFLTTLAADATKLRQIAEGTRDGELRVRFEVPRRGVRGGLNLYGARLGAYPIDPLLILETA